MIHDISSSRLSISSIDIMSLKGRLDAWRVDVYKYFVPKGTEKRKLEKSMNARGFL